MNKVLAILKKPTIVYIIVNILISSLGFIRSFIFMRWLGMEELGLISLAQTVMQFISLFQIGLINGGYRLFSLNKLDDQQKVNNTLFTFFTVLTSVFLFAWCIIGTSGSKIIMENDLLLISIICGVLMLTNNWLNNTLIGKQKLSEINCINIVAGLLSLFCMVSVIFVGFWGAVFSIAVQPLVFVALTLIRNKDLRPTAFYFDFKLIKYILSFGFIPFLSGIFVMINLQIERWSIATYLGTEALGCFYLVFLFNSLYLLVPSSIQNIFFPRAVKAYDQGEMSNFCDIIKKQTLAMIVYDVIVIVLTILLLGEVVAILFPKHVDNVKYVYYYLPGLLAMSFVEVTGLVLNATVRLKPILIGGLISFLSYVIIVPILISTHTMNLTAMSIQKSIALFLPFMIQLTFILLNWKSIKKGYNKKTS